jgi:hypothetical protein
MPKAQSEVEIQRRTDNIMNQSQKDNILHLKLTIKQLHKQRGERMCSGRVRTG